MSSALIDMKDSMRREGDRGTVTFDRIRFETMNAWDDFGIYLCMHVENGATGQAEAQPKVVEMEVIKKGDARRPLMRLEYSEAEQLMDSLWACGVRPRDESMGASQFKAVQAHVEDAKAVRDRLLTIVERNNGTDSRSVS